MLAAPHVSCSLAVAEKQQLYQSPAAGSCLMVEVSNLFCGGCRDSGRSCTLPLDPSCPSTSLRAEIPPPASSHTGQTPALQPGYRLLWNLHTQQPRHRRLGSGAINNLLEEVSGRRGAGPGPCTRTESAEGREPMEGGEPGLAGSGGGLDMSEQHLSHRTAAPELRSRLKEARLALDELRRSSVKEHERVLHMSQQARLLLRQHQRATLKEVEEEGAELERRLAILTHHNQTRLQEGLTEIQRKQEQMWQLCDRLQAPVSAAEGQAGSTDAHRHVARLLSQARSVDISLMTPRFVPRPRPGLALGQIVSEERSVRFSVPVLCPGTEAPNGGSPAEIRAPERGTGTETSRVDCRAGHRLATSPGISDVLQGSVEGHGLWGRDGAAGQADDKTLASHPGRMTGGLAAAPDAWTGGVLAVKRPATEGCVQVSSLTAKAGEPEPSPDALEAPEEVGGREVAAPFTAPAPFGRWTQGPGVGPVSAPGARAPCPTGSDAPAEVSTLAAATPGRDSHLPRHQKPPGALHLETDTERFSDTAAPSAPACGKLPAPVSVCTGPLHQPPFQVRSRHSAEESEPPRVGRTGSPPSSPADGGSLFRVTRLFISEEVPVGFPCAEQVSALDTDRSMVEGAKACQPPAASDGQTLAGVPGPNAPTSTHGNSLSTEPAEQRCSGIPARAKGAANSRRRLKRRPFSRSCLDLSTSGEAPALRPRTAHPGPADTASLSQRSSSPSDSVDSAVTFLVDSSGGSGERKEATAGAANSVGRQRRGSTGSQVTKTPGREVNTGASSRGRLPRMARRPRPDPALKAERAKPLGHPRTAAAPRPRVRPRAAGRDPEVKGTRPSCGSQPSGSLHLGHNGASPELGRWAAPRPRSRSEANLNVAWRGAAPFCRNELVEQFGRFGCCWGDLNLPYGIHAGRQGAVYVVDYGNRRLQARDPNGKASQQISLERDTYFDVAVNGPGLVALTSISNRSVDVYSTDGQLLNVLSSTFENPRGITVNAQDQFLVADTKQGSISVLTLDPRTAQGVERRVVTGFHKPYFISANGLGRVAVSERAFGGGCCVKVLDGELRVLAVLGCGSPGPRLCNPWGVCIDERGNVLVADWGRRHSLLLFPAQGAACAVVESGLSSPRGLALVRHGHVAVVDSMHNCIKVFRYL